MAIVQYQVAGGTITQGQAHNVAALKAQLSLSNHSAMVNGVAVDDNYTFSDYDFVTFTVNVKGAAKKPASKKATKKKTSKK